MRTINKSISIVVPVYKANDHIEALVNRVCSVAAFFADYELILVDDASGDGTAAHIHAMAAANPHIKAVCLSKNAGQQRATFEGLRCATKELVATLDDDLQQDPQDLMTLYGTLKTGHDIVYGVKTETGHLSAVRKLGTWMREKTIAHLSRQKKRVPVTSFRLMTKALADEIIKSRVKHIYISMEVLKRTANIAFVPVAYAKTNTSRYSFFSLIKTLGRLYLGYGWMARISRKN